LQSVKRKLDFLEEPIFDSRAINTENCLQISQSNPFLRLLDSTAQLPTFQSTKRDPSIAEILIPKLPKNKVDSRVE
jgi:hypothetical protein